MKDAKKNATVEVIEAFQKLNRTFLTGVLKGIYQTFQELTT